MSKGLRNVFSEVAGRYELVNHAMTWGLDIVWRRKAARLAAAQGGTRWMDMCSGTGEMAVYLDRLAGGKAEVVAADFSMPMISKAAAKPDAQKVLFTLADAKSLPFPDASFDLVTISFATRNMNLDRENLTRCFSEFHRVLRPGGRFVNVETSQPPSGLVRKLFHFYVRITVKPLGRIISGSSAGYTYLSRTIPRFYEAEELADIMRQAGFPKVGFQRMMFGVVAIHQAVK